MARRRLVIADYELPPGPLAAGFWRRAIALVESPYFRGFVDAGISPLLGECGLDESRRQRLLPAFVVVRVDVR